MQSSQTSQGYIFHILQCFATKLHNFNKFRMLFSAVLMNTPNSKVCLKGESSIVFSLARPLVLQSFLIVTNFFFGGGGGAH